MNANREDQAFWAFAENVATELAADFVLLAGGAALTVAAGLVVRWRRRGLKRRLDGLLVRAEAIAPVALFAMLVVCVVWFAGRLSYIDWASMEAGCNLATTGRTRAVELAWPTMNTSHALATGCAARAGPAGGRGSLTRTC